jgi:hypothetical protein
MKTRSICSVRFCRTVPHRSPAPAREIVVVQIAACLQPLHFAAVERVDGDDRNSQHLAEPVDVDADRLLLRHVDHREDRHDRQPHFGELHREVEVALDVARVDDVDDEVRLAAGESAFLLLHGDPGPVPDLLSAAGQAVEDRRLSAVRVSGNCNGDAA